MMARLWSWGSDFESINTIIERVGYLVSYIKKELLCENRARMWILQIPA